ncbi:MAG: 4-phosphoerythronate dehydrogenase PdxB [Bacteroidetes bacterium]|jgi:erythronate-4-phosphate dehydrogenase|nr:4-phosphoerythronate dehydrogenase PdxB [Bacteroidota bacterium]
MPKIIVDQNIPFINGLLEKFADVFYLSPQDITPEVVKDADGLIIRTRTRCNEALLSGSKVKFIATATIGIDHIDQSYCKNNGITYTNSPGCNAGSVKQYILASLLQLAQSQKVDLRDRTLGIVGVGHVGLKSLEIAETLGMRVVLNDPPRERNENSCEFISLKQLLKEADIITVHVPLNKEGRDYTYHLFHPEMSESLLPGTWFINSSRGEVVSNEFLNKALKSGRLQSAVLDVWENEPDIDIDLLQHVNIATPHIAGYSMDGKGNATEQCVRAACNFFKWDIAQIDWFQLPEPENKRITIDGTGKSEQTILYEAIRTTYDILIDDAALRHDPGAFESLRSNYRIRREPLAFELNHSNISHETTEKLKKFGFKLV